MKKIIFLVLILIVSFTVIVGCKGKNVEKKPFTMICTTKKDKSKNIETQIVVTYNFNEEQLATSYISKTTQNFKNKKTYEAYKKEKEEIFNKNDSNTISYILEPNDEKKILKFTMEVRELNINAKSEKDINTIKASTILKRNEKNGATCEINGIRRKQIKN